MNNGKVQNDEIVDESFVPDYVLVGSNFHDYDYRSSTKTYLRSNFKKSFPSNVTLGFRNNFWRVFSKIDHYDKTDIEFSWLEKKWKLLEYWIAESVDVDFATYLDDPRNVFITFVLAPLDQKEFIGIRTLGFNNGLNEQEVISTLIDSIAKTGSTISLKSFKHDRKLNALFTWSDELKISNLEPAVSMFVFYSFCLLMTWKISREQTHISLDVSNRNFLKNMKAVLHLRSQIINVERYFLTKNISNDKIIKRISTSIKKRFGIREKIDAFLPLNEAMERHLTIAAQLRTDAKISILNIVAFVIALIGLPISAVSMLLAIGIENPALQTGILIITEQKIYTLILSTIIITLLAICFIGLVVFYLQRWRR